MRDLTNQRFSSLVARYPLSKRTKQGNAIWHCECDCGNTAEVRGNDLVTGNTKSCGCRNKERQTNLIETLTFVDHTCVDWLRSRKWRNDNTSGYRGVYKRKEGSYTASIGFKGKRYHLGTFSNLDEAVQARRNAEKIVHEDFVKAYDIYAAYAEKHPEWAEKNPFVYDVEKNDGIMHVVRQTVIPTESQRSSHYNKRYRRPLSATGIKNREKIDRI